MLSFGECAKLEKRQGQKKNEVEGEVEICIFKKCQVRFSKEGRRKPSGECQETRTPTRGTHKGKGPEV